MSLHTSELYLNLTIDKLISSKDLPEAAPFVSSITRSMAKRKAVIVIGFLRIIVGANLIHPEGHPIIWLILKGKKCQQDEFKSHVNQRKWVRSFLCQCKIMNLTLK